MHLLTLIALALPSVSVAAQRVTLEIAPLVGSAPAAAPSPLAAGITPTLQGALVAPAAGLGLAPALTPVPALAAAAVPAAAKPVAAAAAKVAPAQAAGAPAEKAIDQLKRESAEGTAALAAELPGLDPGWGLAIKDAAWMTAFRATDRRGATVYLKYRDADGRSDLRKEAETTERVHAEYHDSALAPESPIDPLATLPRVRGIGPFTSAFKGSVSWSDRLRETDAPADLRDGKTVMVVEGLPGKDLNAYYPFKKTDGRVTARQWRALESVVARLHALGYAHGDLAAPNVMLEQSTASREGRVGLIDFEATVRRGEVSPEEFEARVARDRAGLRALKKNIRAMLELEPAK